MTVEGLAAAVEVSTQAANDWRGGRALPRNEHIEALGKVLSRGRSRQQTELELRCIVAFVEIHRKLVRLCGQDRIDDMFSAFLLTVELVFSLLVGPVRDEQPPSLDLEEIATWRVLKEGLSTRIPEVVWEVILHGAASPLGESLSVELARISQFRQPVSVDFLALPGDWIERCRYWMEFFGSARQEGQVLLENASGTLGDTTLDTALIAEVAREAQCRMAGFDWTPDPDIPCAIVPLPPSLRATNQIQQARALGSIGDNRGALERLRCAVANEPLNPLVHFRLGCRLWEEGFRVRELTMVEEALNECQVAVALDPEFGNARNEIGIILSNLGRHDEAAVAFAKAEHFWGDDAHHWFTRGNNYLALSRFEDALAAFSRSIELTKDEEHVLAKARKAATLMALGKTGEAERLGKRVHHLTGNDPTEDWKSVLDVWGDAFGAREWLQEATARSDGGTDNDN